jgi:uncharacterized protein with GYD domain
METYILLLTLTPEGRKLMLEDAESLQRAEDSVDIDGVTCFAIYGVLGEYDFVTILEAPGNDEAAEFSLELGVRAGAHVTTLPAVPMARFEELNRRHRVAEPEAAAPPGDPSRPDGPVGTAG